MDNAALIQAFVENVVAHRLTLLSNPELRLEPIAQSLQLLAKTEGLVATAQSVEAEQMISVRSKSAYWPQLHDILMLASFLPAQKSAIAGFYEYHQVKVPEGYQVNFTDSLDLLQAWWSYKKPGKPQDLMELLVFHRGLWYPIGAVNCDRGKLLLETLGQPIEIFPLDKLVWLQKQHSSLPQQPIQLSVKQSVPVSVEQPVPTLVQQLVPPIQHPSVLSTQPTSPQPDQPVRPIPADLHTISGHPKGHGRNDHSVKVHPSTKLLPPSTIKQIGSYLVDAGLLSPAQVELALYDQERTGMRFGEILVCRGWLKQQTIEFLMQEVILPHRAAAKKEAELTKRRLTKRLEQVQSVQKNTQRKPSIHERETFVTQEPPELEDFL